MEPNSPGLSRNDAFALAGKDVLGVRKLRKELGYSSDDNLFNQTITSFISNFTTDRGEKGETFTRRADPDHQEGLRSMAEKFLEHDGNGPLFWPNDPASPNYGRLQYSTHRDQIRNTLIKLFWKHNQRYQQYQHQRGIRDQITSNASRQVAAQRNVPTQHQGRSRGNHAGLEQLPHSDAVLPPIGPRTNESPGMPSPAATLRPASPSFPDYNEEPVGDFDIQNTRGESLALGEEFLRRPVVPMAPMTDAPDDRTSRRNEPARARERQQKKKNRATHPDLGQDTRSTKRRRQEYSNNASSHRTSVGAFAPNLRTDPAAGPSHSPSRSRRPPSRYGDDYYTGEEALEMMKSPAPSSADDELEPVNLQNPNKEARTESRLLTPPPVPRQDTVETVGRAVGDLLVEDLEPRGPLGDRLPSASQSPPALDDDLVLQGTSMPDDDVEKVQVSVPQLTRGLGPGFDHSQPLKIDHARENARESVREDAPENAREDARESARLDAPENTPNRALGGASNHGVDHNNPRPTEEEAEEMPLPPVNHIYISQLPQGVIEIVPLRSTFSELSLRELLDNMPLEKNYSRVLIRLDIGKPRAQARVSIGNEAHFQQTKYVFQQVIETIRLRRRGQTSMFVRITVEPIN